MEQGEIGVLNVGAGDTKLSFDPTNPVERERACRIVEDMIKRGFLLLVQAGEKDGKPLYQRAEGFDPATAEYIIADYKEPFDEPKAAPGNEARDAAPRRGRRVKTTRRIDAGQTSGVAVARVAGG